MFKMRKVSAKLWIGRSFSSLQRNFNGLWCSSASSRLWWFAWPTKASSGLLSVHLGAFKPRYMLIKLRQIDKQSWTYWLSVRNSEVGWRTNISSSRHQIQASNSFKTRKYLFRCSSRTACNSAKRGNCRGPGSKRLIRVPKAASSAVVPVWEYCLTMGRNATG